MAKKLWNIFQICRQKGGYSHTFGALDPVQVIEMAPHLLTVYVSGWQCSSTASTSNEPGPDFADYPMDTVPNKVDQLFRAQCHHDRRQWEERCNMNPSELATSGDPIDFLRPIIADGDTGHGGLTAVMKLTKMFIEKGAAGIHFEDQKPGTKKCGHMGGKVLVSMQDHCDRLIASRLQADIMGTDTIIVARTDADASTLLDSNIDPRDHPFILGCTNPSMRSLNVTMKEAANRGADANELNEICMKWSNDAKLMRFPELIENAIRSSNLPNKQNLLIKWAEKAYNSSHSEARKYAEVLLGGKKNVPFFCWELPRSREGYYKLKGGTDYCIARGRAYAPYADLIWMETAKPVLKEAEKFANGMHETHPHQMLAYNLSPSFNWDTAGMSKEEMGSFNRDLGKLGYVFQFITLAGFHSDGLISSILSREYGKHGIIKYVELIQRKEREEQVDLLTHQKWSGADLMDRQVKLATGGVSSTSSMGEGVTEAQFRNVPNSKL
eukprot:CAMPEP_0171457630 /NCGR_PEP_ID=MMETSP0945-20130129/3633_1 /TAXON_ID=109269 /ORGANISM="Vaucheria litorea, Strain CCMP2940" /LENGTH=495 /DNA_ID=CAMNT_0011983279 /DNA_START=218 /DNA_END=1705 /DNA_ORIENTATION=+